MIQCLLFESVVNRYSGEV